MKCLLSCLQSLPFIGPDSCDTTEDESRNSTVLTPTVGDRGLGTHLPISRASPDTVVVGQRSSLRDPKKGLGGVLLPRPPLPGALLHYLSYVSDLPVEEGWKWRRVLRSPGRSVTSRPECSSAPSRPMHPKWCLDTYRGRGGGTHRRTCESKVTCASFRLYSGD